MSGISTVLYSPLTKAQRGFQKVLSLIPIYGFWGALKIVSKNILMLEIMYRLDKDLGFPEEIVQAKVPIQVVPHSSLDFNHWEGTSAILKLRGPYGIRQFKERFTRGDILFTAHWERNFIGFVWLQFPPVTGAGYDLRPDEAYTFDGWTFEEFRGKRCLAVIQQAIFAYLRLHYPHIKNVVTHVATWNKPSLSMDTRAGYKTIRKELTIVVLGYHRKIKFNAMKDSLSPISR